MNCAVNAVSAVSHKCHSIAEARSHDGAVSSMATDALTIQFVDNGEDVPLGLHHVNQGVLIVLRIHYDHVIVVAEA